jgi:hypothetical protein
MLYQAVYKRKDVSSLEGVFIYNDSAICEHMNETPDGKCKVVPVLN